MKRAVAIVLSLMFLWVQAMASAPTNFAFAPARSSCACGNCTQMGCCVTPAPAELPALPVAVAATTAQIHLAVVAPPFVVWTLPVTATPPISASASAPLLAPGVPLFARHCARLI